jgi:hypothetical protein
MIFQLQRMVHCLTKKLIEKQADTIGLFFNQRVKKKNENGPSRNRTYIRNLEGFGPSR